MTTVYFATNRKKDGTGEFGFGAQIVGHDAAQITYGVAEVTNIDLADESSGAISNPTDIAFGKFGDASRRDIIAADRNLLVFIHGFDNTFEDAIRRAAFNHDWLAASGVAGETTVIAFTWPSAGVAIASPPTGLDEAYETDQAQAGKSGFHLVNFLANVDSIQRDFRKANPNGRVFLLAHSMGNWALQAGVQAWFDSRGANDRMFDEVFLAAADEDADTFEQRAGARLSTLPKIAKRISIYSSRGDIVIWVATTINLSVRLGFDGPSDGSDTAKYPLVQFRSVDCSEVEDYDRLSPFDASHQYYRRSKIVRADIPACMADKPAVAGGRVAL